MWIHTLNPAIISVGPLEIRWYGLAYVLGFFLTVWWMQYLRKKGELKLSKDEIWDFGFWILVGVIIGSRLFEVFWQPAYYLSNPLNFLKIWEGGMSFHGGFTGTLVAVWWFCKKKNLNIAKMFDILAVPTIFALALGRLANFMNGELWGRPFNGKWCVNFKNTGGGDVCRHPSVLYAAGKRFIVFGWLLFLTLKNNFKPGFIALNFVLWEGLGRFIVDFYRYEQIYYFGLTMGQLLSSVMIISASWFLIKNYEKEWKKIF